MDENSSNKMTNQTADFTILVPVYNEAEVVNVFMETIDPVVKEIESRFGFSVELIFTDNCSTDNTYALLAELSQIYKYVKVFRFSQNVGFQRSILSGYSFATGKACVQIDCDLEDPPHLILGFIEKWQEGYMVVYGQRMMRHESRLMRFIRGRFYSIVNYLSEIDIPQHAGDFRLIDRRIIDIVCQVNDAQPYLRGLIANLGFRQTGIKYDRDKRIAGTSSFSLVNYISLAIEGILHSSVRPLTLALFIGAVSFALSMCLIVFYFLYAIFGNNEVSGFATIVILSLIQFCLLMLVIGINSLYLGRLFRQAFRRPVSSIDKSNVKHLEASQLTYWPTQPMHKNRCPKCDKVLD